MVFSWNWKYGPRPPLPSLSNTKSSMTHEPVLCVCVCVCVCVCAQVFSGSGLDFITRQRVEHLPEAEKHKHKSFNPLQDLLGGAAPANAHALPDPTPEATPPTTTAATAAKKESSHKLSMQEYFKPPEDCKAYDGERSCYYIYTCILRECCAVDVCKTHLYMRCVQNSPVAVCKSH